MMQIIPTEEAIKISEKSATLNELQWAASFVKQHPETDDPIWDRLLMVANAFYAGKIQGIREERYRQRKRLEKKKALTLTADQSTRERA